MDKRDNSNFLINVLFDRGVLGVGKVAEIRRDNAFLIMELYVFLEGAPLSQSFKSMPVGTKTIQAERVLSEEEDRLQIFYHRYLRELPAEVTQTLRFLCKDEQLPRIQTVPIAECLDQLDVWRRKEQEENLERENDLPIGKPSDLKKFHE